MTWSMNEGTAASPAYEVDFWLLCSLFIWFFAWTKVYVFVVCSCCCSTYLSSLYSTPKYLVLYLDPARDVQRFPSFARPSECPTHKQTRQFLAHIYTFTLHVVVHHRCLMSSSLQRNESRQVKSNQIKSHPFLNLFTLFTHT
jgi:hypothetical protein